MCENCEKLKAEVDALERVVDNLVEELEPYLLEDDYQIWNNWCDLD